MNYSIPLNAFSSITVRGLVSNQGEPYAQTLNRGILKPGRQLSMGYDPIIRPGGIPVRPVSTLPPPGNQHLTLSLGERLGEGRAGSVYAVNVLEHHLASSLPPLVMKISCGKKYINMAQEAWFYEELEQLQGIAVPQCYGFFQVRVEDGQRVSFWSRQDYAEQNEPDQKVVYTDEGPSSDNVDMTEIVRKMVQVARVEAAKSRAIDQEYERQIANVPGGGPILAVLILERLGGFIPVGQPNDSIKADVFEIFNDLARFGVETLDIRWSNILSANDESVSDSPGRICPNHGHAHQWRLIDFELGRQTDATVNFIDSVNEEWLEVLFENLAAGRMVEF